MLSPAQNLHLQMSSLAPGHLKHTHRGEMVSLLFMARACPFLPDPLLLIPFCRVTMQVLLSSRVGPGWVLVFWKSLPALFITQPVAPGEANGDWTRLELTLVNPKSPFLLLWPAHWIKLLE